MEQSEPLKVETWPVKKVVPYARNPRKNEGVPLAKVKASLKEFGWRQPIVVDSEGVIIVGHTRYQAALELGMTEIPVHVAEGLTAAQVKAYRIADNKTGDFAEWDFDLLKLEFADLQELDFGLDLTGFDDDAIDGIMVDATPEGNTDPDEVPDVPEEPVSKPGDVWILGNHRLMCGDSTVATDVERLLGEQEIDLVFTDPPYGMRLDTDYSKMPRGKKKYTPVIGDDEDFDPSCIFLVRAKRFMIWGADWFYDKMPDGFSPIVWDKQPFECVAGPQNHFELCWIKPKRKRETFRHLWTGFTAKEKGESRVHPTQKPVELTAKLMGLDDGKSVFDGFSGSGTTIIAAEMTGRCCYAMELNPAYVDVAVKRWEDFTGKKAVLEGSNAEG